jgi:hypothetical protein
MNGLQMPVLMGGLCAVLLLSGCQCGQTTDADSAELSLDGADLRVTGPYEHENLAVFLIHADKQVEGDYLTLDEGLRQNVVKITEMEQEQVGELQLDNQSDQPLYLQEGERLSGGKQDRIIIASMVVPPHSGMTSVPTFCIEQSRWQERESGRAFGYTTNTALAPKGVRGAAKVDGTQTGVWKCVEKQKDTANARFKAANTNSSANEMLDAPQVRKISEEYGTDLDAALGDQPSAVGVAIVVNGTIEEVNVYPNHQLLRKLYPRLVRSYAVQAAMLKDQAGDQKVSASDVAAFMRGGEETNRRDRELDSRNNASIRELAHNQYECTTRYKGERVHWQMLRRNGAEMRKNGDDKKADGAADILGTEW